VLCRRRAGAGAIVGLPAAPAAADLPGEPDCTGPAGNPKAGTPAWYQRENDNAWCGEQRYRDTTSNPAYAAAKSEMDARNGAEVFGDPFRDPLVLGGKRFRYQHVAFKSPSGQALSGYLFRPCDASCKHMPTGLRRYKPRYPGVVVVHGGAAQQEMYFWGAEGLAEAGYMVLTFQIPEPDNAQSDFHYPDTKAALKYFLSRPGHRTRAHEVNPRWKELDREHIGLAGHSAGGVAVSRLGQEDRRVSAIVSWDRAQSSTMPKGLRIRTPALFLVADYLCQQVPVCVPQPFCKLQECHPPQSFTSQPDPYGPGNKDEDFRRVSGAHVDSMKVTLRAATHLDFTQFTPGTGSRYGAVVSFYYTLAWFDRYLRRDRDRPGERAVVRNALQRLLATRFDRSADVHNVSGGTYDPAKNRNVPAFIGGQPVRNRLSFEFRSAYYLDHGRYRCKEIRAGCATTRP
jgi:dienelactone hydrolase